MPNGISSRTPQKTLSRFARSVIFDGNLRSFPNQCRKHIDARKRPATPFRCMQIIIRLGEEWWISEKVS
jgi:hypothetical protein